MPLTGKDPADMSPSNIPEVPRANSVLLLGPTGSGKTPLGDTCEREGLWGRKSAHFDFGVSLRRAAEGDRGTTGLSDRDLGVIRRSLRTGALLENDQFHIARSLLAAFLDRSRLDGNGVLVLNGLPRHLGQAEALTGVVEVRLVLHLDCRPAVVHRRVSSNAGGDRDSRIDDSLAEVETRVAIFRERTLPLLRHYQENGVRVEPYPVGVETTADEVHRWLQTLRVDW